MYKIEKKDFGLYLTFGGIIYPDEMEKWLEEITAALKNPDDQFTVFVDMRTLKPLPKESQEFMRDGQKFAKKQGMVRSMVILDNPVTTIQFKRIAQETGIYDWERYIDASEDPNWEQTGMDWLLHAVDPDKQKVKTS